VGFSFKLPSLSSAQRARNCPAHSQACGSYIRSPKCGGLTRHHARLPVFLYVGQCATSRRRDRFGKQNSCLFASSPQPSHRRALDHTKRLVTARLSHKNWTASLKDWNPPRPVRVHSNRTTLASLGFDDFFASQLAALAIRSGCLRASSRKGQSSLTSRAAAPPLGDLRGKLLGSLSK